jgi:hypothetical protein
LALTRAGCGAWLCRPARQHDGRPPRHDDQRMFMIGMDKITAMSFSCRRFFTVDQPRYRESINDHAESKRPEGLLNGYLHHALFRQSIEEPSHVIMKVILPPRHFS